MYARTDVGGAYKWNAATNTWVPLLDWNSVEETSYQGVDALAIDPQAPAKVYMLVGTSYWNSGKTAIIRSSDYGKTFSVTDVTSQFKTSGNGMGRQNGERLAVDPNKGDVLFCGTRGNGLFKSTNSGASWSNVTFPVSTTPNGCGLNFVVFDPSSATSGNATQTLFVGASQTTNNLFVSKNGGASFSAVSGAPTGFMPQRGKISGDYLYITYADLEGPWNPKTGQIWKYNIKTSNWTNITPSGTTFPYGGISIDPNNPQRLIASTINVYYTQYPNVYGDRFFLSTDGGSSWRDLVGNSGITLDANGCTWVGSNSIHWAGSMEFDPFNTKKAWVTSGNGVFVCENVDAATTTWKFNVKGLEETVPLDIVSIPNGPLVSVIGDYDGFVHTDITKYAPIHTPRMGTTTGLAYSGTTSNLLVRVGSDMYYSTNQGNSWTKTSSVKGAKGKVAVSADGKTILHCPEGSSTTYYSTDKGSSWTTCAGLNIPDATPIADPVNPDKFYAYQITTGTFYTSTNGGKNFSTSLTLNNYGSAILRPVPAKEGDLWYAANWDGLKRSTNSGQSFAKLSSVQECAAVGFGKSTQGKTFPTVFIWGKVNNVVGIFSSVDEGVSWTRINDNDHEYGGPGNGQFVIGDMNIVGRVYMSTVGRGIVYGEPSTTTSIGEIVDYTGELNTTISFPNPFYQTFSIRSESAFEYALFDMAGTRLESGNGDSSTSIGADLLPGMYLVKVKAGASEKVMKVVKH